MAIRYTHVDIVDATASVTDLYQAIGTIVVRFTIDFVSHPHPARKYRFEQVRAVVNCGSPGNSEGLLGIAYPESPIMFYTSPNKYKEGILFAITVSHAQFAAVERIRNGGGLNFNLIVQGIANGPDGPALAFDSVRCAIEQSVWLKLLKDGRLLDTLLFEIPIPIGEGTSAISSAVKHLAKARDLFLAGHYNEAVATCRRCLEALSETPEQSNPQSVAIAAYRSDKLARESMTATQRMFFLREATRHYTQLAHHDEMDGSVSEYSRRDALAILGVTAALLAQAAGTPTNPAV